MEYHPSRLPLNELVDYVVQLFLSHADQKKITLCNHIPETVVVYADTNMISTVVRNLISNALKFTDIGGRIDIFATQNTHKVEVVVQDTGTGISEEDLPHLFRIDKKLSRTGTVGEKGTGLGLPLCKDLIEKNGGGVWVESEPGKGTAFRFTLPCQP
jgi:signal transduction histidine kinase